ncbi:hypothetical protein [Desulfogranum mediterraneum]|uniref:hypothetical protein n=1 Tax=Desulfogranum mediterraneum TaxID=160661 RepID=UPI00041CA28B|nr:hypothetical protein [Desulfogranum mediterraneum]
MNLEQALRDLEQFRGGVVDTSSLIYLRKLSLLTRVSSCYRLLLPHQVAREYGRPLPPGLVMVQAGTLTADQAVSALAGELAMAVISEDKGVLKAARAQGLVHFNTLMLLLALYRHGHCGLEALLASQQQLREFARYGPLIWGFAESLLEQLRPFTESGAKTIC